MKRNRKPHQNAIGCHTTLKAEASWLDKIVFVADKLKWDQVGDPPYLAAKAAAAERSLDAAALCYFEHLWQRWTSLAVLHPWAIDAYRQLRSAARACCSPP
jgi:HD superfamily phosphohydrolase YqeK